MVTPVDQAIQSEKPKSIPQRQIARPSDPEIISSSVTQVVRQATEPLTDEQRREFIAVAAFYLAERRHFEPGHEQDDWLAAETQIGGQARVVS
jgi:hypothetical protein